MSKQAVTNANHSHQASLAAWEIAQSETEIEDLVRHSDQSIGWIEMYNVGELSAEELRIYCIEYFDELVNGKRLDI